MKEQLICSNATAFSLCSIRHLQIPLSSIDAMAYLQIISFSSYASSFATAKSCSKENPYFIKGAEEFFFFFPFYTDLEDKNRISQKYIVSSTKWRMEEDLCCIFVLFSTF